MRLLGAHMSIAGGVDRAIERGQSLDCTAIQIFVKNNNRWSSPPLKEEETERFITLQKETGIFVFAHTGYLINLASPDVSLRNKSIKSMIDELNRCEALKLPFTALQLKTLVKSIDEVLKATKDYHAKILLETTAGQGSNLGYKFEHLADILDAVKEPKRLGICFDTCHSFAAGYDIKSKEGYENTWKEFDKLLGFKKLMAFHLNDSKNDLGSRTDRHEHIGKGTLGKEPFERLLNDHRFKDMPMVIETPKDPEMKFDRMNLRTLRSLIH